MTAPGDSDVDFLRDLHPAVLCTTLQIGRKNKQTNLYCLKGSLIDEGSKPSRMCFMNVHRKISHCLISPFIIHDSHY